MNYSEALQVIKKRQSKKLANNTYLHRLENSDSLAICLHKTDIIIIDKDNTITLNSNSWRTATTKNRLNKYLNHFTIYQKNNVWYLGHDVKNPISEFYDGLQIKNGQVINPKLSDNKKTKKDKAKIKKFVDAFILALDEGKIKTPSNGDCWYCLFKDQNTSETLGQKVKSNHIEKHIKEKYFVPSLLFEAVKTFGVSKIAKSYIGFKTGIHNEGLGIESFENLAKNQIEKALTRFIYRQMEYAS